MADYSYIGSGKVYLRDTATTENLIAIGNASALSMDIQSEEKSLTDYTQPGGGTYNSVEKVTDVNVSITVHDYSPRNLSIALFGDDSVLSGATVNAEVHTGVNAGEFIKTEYPFISSVTVEIQGGGTTYTEGTDYEVRDSGIYILEGTTIAADGNIQITYTHATADRVEALVSSGKTFQLVFEGQNEATGKRALVDIYRLKFSPTNGLNLIGDDYGALEMSGKSLSDSTKTGVGVSKYFRIDQEQ